MSIFNRGINNMCSNNIVSSLVAVDNITIASNGSATAPVLRFLNDLDTGLYLKNTGELSVAADGKLSATFDTSGLETKNIDCTTINASGEVKSATINTNSITASGNINADTIGSVNTSLIGLSLNVGNDVNCSTINTNNLVLNNSNASVKLGNGSANTPSYSFYNANNMGFYYDNNTLGMAVNGTPRMVSAFNQNTFYGKQIIANNFLEIDQKSPGNVIIFATDNGTPMWKISLVNLNTGSNNGSDLRITACDDNGSDNGNIITITRSTKKINITTKTDFNTAPNFNDLLLTNNSNFMSDIFSPAFHNVQNINVNASNFGDHIIQRIGNYVTISGRAFVEIMTGGAATCDSIRFGFYPPAQCSTLWDGKAQHVNGTGGCKITNTNYGGMVEILPNNLTGNVADQLFISITCYNSIGAFPNGNFCRVSYFVSYYL